MNRSAALAFLVVAAVSTMGLAQAEPAQGAIADVHAKLMKVVPNLQASKVRPAPVPGWFEVQFTDGVAYVSGDGKYLIKGDLFDVATRTNLTDARRSGERLEALAMLQEKDMIVFSPAQPKHTITVFTDVDCGYCRKLHSEMAKLNELGVKVRYVAFPRTGPNTESWTKMEAVWCSKDQRDAITRAKLGEKVEKPQNCGDTSIAAQYALGGKLGLQGTPMIVLEDGNVISGYMPPAQLVQQLDSVSAQKTAAVAR